MITGRAQKLTFEPDKKAYRYGMTRHCLPASICFGCPEGVQGPPANPHKMIENPITFKGNAITFAPTGVMQAGTAYLCNKQFGYAYALTCAVAQVSYLRKYHYNDRWELV